MELSFFDQLQYSIFRSFLGRYVYKYMLYKECDLPDIVFKDEELTITGTSYGDNNYSYLLTIGDTTLLIDPGHSHPYSELQDVIVLLTHTHWDHSAGLYDLDIQECYSYGNIGTRLIPEQVMVFGNVTITVKPISTHTVCSVVFEMRYKDKLLLFTGDTLFNCGTGKFFEGHAEPLLQYISELKTMNNHHKQAWIFPGHDYLMDNALWCKELDVDVPQMSIPFTLASQCLYSPFFNVDAHRTTLQDKYGLIIDELDGLNKLRKWKNEFSPGL